MIEKEVSFEESMAKLKEVIIKLESNSSTLDEMVELYEEGIRLTNKCKKQLTQAENRITTLLNENGKYVEVDNI